MKSKEKVVRPKDSSPIIKFNTTITGNVLFFRMSNCILAVIVEILFLIMLNEQKIF